MTKRQKLIVLWLVNAGADAITNAKREGLPRSRSDWNGFAEKADDPEPTTAEIEEVVALMNRGYHHYLPDPKVSG